MNEARKTWRSPAADLLEPPEAVLIAAKNVEVVVETQRSMAATIGRATVRQRRRVQRRSMRNIIW